MTRGYGRIFQLASRSVEATNLILPVVREAIPSTAVGKINTYALFSELFSCLVKSPRSSEDSNARVKNEYGGRDKIRKPSGHAGLIVPVGIATDASTSTFFGRLIAENRLAALLSFFEVRRWFKDTDDRKPFCVLVMASHAEAIPLISRIKEVDDISEEERKVYFEQSDFSFFNPNTKTAPLFQSRADRDLTRKLYQVAPILVRESDDHPDSGESPWGVSFQQGMYNMTSASGWFRTGPKAHRRGVLSRWAELVSRRRTGLCSAVRSQMIHHFDHRFGSYEGLERRPRDGSLPEASNSRKLCADFEVEPWYWVPAEETSLRAARVPSRLKKSYREKKSTACLKVLTEWIVGTFGADELSPSRLARNAVPIKSKVRDILGERALVGTTLGMKNFVTWLSARANAAVKMQRQTPLTEEDLEFIRKGPSDVLELVGALVDRKQPCWFIGLRDITNAESERTVIGCVLPTGGIGHNLPICHPDYRLVGAQLGALVGVVSSITLDYVARQKISGTHLTFFYTEQLPVIAPKQFTREELSFISPRVLELTYTSHALKAWAQELGFSGPPFAFNIERRAGLRAELDAFYARKYCLRRDELRFILDPADTHGETYPSATFRVLKQNELERYGEYRTQRLILEAYDRLTWV